MEKKTIWFHYALKNITTSVQCRNRESVTLQKSMELGKGTEGKVDELVLIKQSFREYVLNFFSLFAVRNRHCFLDKLQSKESELNWYRNKVFRNLHIVSWTRTEHYGRQSVS